MRARLFNARTADAISESLAAPVLHTQRCQWRDARSSAPASNGSASLAFLSEWWNCRLRRLGPHFAEARPLEPYGTDTTWS